MKLNGQYVYCARHGEYLPAQVYIADQWYAELNEPGAEPQPDWVVPEIIEDGFDDVDPDGSQFIRLSITDEVGLMAALESLFAEVAGGPAGGDDDTFDYWPSGVLLLQAMGYDLTAPAHCARYQDMRSAIAQVILDEQDELADELLEKVGLKEPSK